MGAGSCSFFPALPTVQPLLIAPDAHRGAKERAEPIFGQQIHARPVGDNAFKIELARRVVKRALSLAAAGTPQTPGALPASPFGG